MTETAASPPDALAAHGLAEFLTAFPADPDTPVLHWADGSLTLAELTSAARDLADRLGPLAGAPVACVVDQGRRAMVAMFAVWLAGGVYVPVNARLTDPEIRAQLQATGPAAVLVGGPQADRVPGRYRVLVEGRTGWWGAGTSAFDTPQQRYSGDEAIIMRTSGTTGASKPVVLDHTGVRDGIDAAIAQLRGGRPPRPGRTPMPNLVPTSLALWAGIWNALFAFRAGAAVVLLERFDTVECAELIRRFGIRSTILAPAMMAMLAEDPRVTDLGALRFVRSVTAPLPPDQARRFRVKFGADVLNCYGQTELGGEVVGWTAADLRDFGEAKLGSVGRPHRGVAVRVVDDRGVEPGPGGVGEILVRSPYAAMGRLPADRVVDGFIRTGDIGSLDADGFLWISGRVSDMVNRGGLKVIPQEVEEALRRHPEVADAVVAGVPDSRLGEVPVALVRPAAGVEPSGEGLLAFVRQSLAGYKVPVAVRFVADFPRNEIGKVLRRDLVASFTADPTGPDSAA